MDFVVTLKMPHCFAPGCNHNSVKQDPCKFYRFPPINSKEYKAWMKCTRSRQQLKPDSTDHLDYCLSVSQLKPAQESNNLSEEQLSSDLPDHMADSSSVFNVSESISIATKGASMVRSSIYCCVPSCVSSKSSRNEADITFHRFPKNAQRHSLWVTKCFGPDCTEDWLNIVVSGKQSLYICSQHFTPDDFTDTFVYGDLLQYNKKRSLKASAVPSVGLPHHAQVNKPEQMLSKARPAKSLVDIYNTDDYITIGKRTERKPPPEDCSDKEPISVKLKRLREEGKKRILQLIKENEEIYKCPIHKINSPTCSIENCVLRAKRKPSITKSSVKTEESMSSLEIDSGNVNSHFLVGKTPDPFTCDVVIKSECETEEVESAQEDELHGYQEENEVSRPTSNDTIEVIQGSTGETLLFKLLKTRSSPGEDYQTLTMEHNPSYSTESYSSLSENSLIQHIVDNADPTKRTVPAILKRQSCVDSFDANGTGGDSVESHIWEESCVNASHPGRITRRKQYLQSRRVSFELSETHSDSDSPWETLVNGSESGSSYRLIEPALTNPTRPGTGEDKSVAKIRTKSEKLSKIRKIDRLISENNILIGNLSGGLDKRKRKSCASLSYEERKSKRSSVEVVDQSVTKSHNSNKENSLVNQIPPLVAIGSHNPYETEMDEQNSRIERLRERIRHLEAVNRRLKSFEKENIRLRSIIAEGVAGIETTTPSSSLDRLSSSDDTDRLLSSDNTDRLLSSDDTDRLLSSDDTDRLLSSDDTDRLLSSDDTDRLLSSNDTDRLLSSDDTDRLLSSDDTDRLLSSDDTDRLLSSDDTDRLLSSDDTDRLSSSDDTDRLSSSDDTDRLSSSDDTDRLSSSDDTSKMKNTNESDVQNEHSKDEKNTKKTSVSGMKSSVDDSEPDKEVHRSKIKRKIVTIADNEEIFIGSQISSAEHGRTPILGETNIVSKSEKLRTCKDSEVISHTIGDNLFPGTSRRIGINDSDERTRNSEKEADKNEHSISGPVFESRKDIEDLDKTIDEDMEELDEIGSDSDGENSSKNSEDFVGTSKDNEDFTETCEGPEDIHEACVHSEELFETSFDTEELETSKDAEDLVETSYETEDLDGTIEDLVETSDDITDLIEANSVGNEQKEVETNAGFETGTQFIDPDNLQEYVVLQSCTKDGYTEVQVIRNEDYIKMRESGMVVNNLEGESISNSQE